MKADARPHTTLWATGGSLLAAVIASACCWLPLVLLTFGASAAGAATFFERLRPWFLVAAALLLGAGFYSHYFRRPECRPGDSCRTPSAAVRRANRIILWTGTVAVAAFAFFPGWAAEVLGRPGAANTAAAPATATTVLEIDGMTCAACAITVEEALRGVHGVVDATVSHEEGVARVSFRAGYDLGDELVAAVGRAGYVAAPAGSAR